MKDIAADLREYGNLGVLVEPDDLVALEDMAQQARERRATAEKTMPDHVKAEYNATVKIIDERLVELELPERNSLPIRKVQSPPNSLMRSGMCYVGTGRFPPAKSVR